MSDLAGSRVRIQLWYTHSKKPSRALASSKIRYRPLYQHSDRSISGVSPKLGQHVAKITLAGDTAHQSRSFRGQSFNKAMHDSGFIVSVIKSINAEEKKQKETIGDSEAEMIPRASTEINLSFEQSPFASN